VSARRPGFQRDNESLDATTILAELIMIADQQRDLSKPATLVVSRGYIDRMREALVALAVERARARAIAAGDAESAE
jgi:hypothetical protein